MTVCFFSAQYLPTVGGVERYTFSLAKRFAAAGHRAIVVTSALNGLPAHERDENGIEIFRLPVWPLMKGRFPLLKPGAAFRAVKRELFSQIIDFCVVQTRMYPQSVWAARQLKQRHIPFLVIDHSTGYMPMGGGVIGLCGRLYEHAACGIIKGCGPAFYGVSAAVCRWLCTFGIMAAGTLPNAVDPAELQALGQSAAPHKDWRAEYGLAPSTKLVAYVGRLIPEKGAAALAEAVRGEDGIAVIIAGDGPLLGELKRTAPPNVFCPGSIPYPATVQLLCQADAYCLPTRYAEGFPTTLLEAAACRCPIVCTRTAGTEELFPDESRAVLLDDATPEAIHAGLDRLLQNTESADFSAACAAAAYANLCAHFTWDAVFGKMIDVIGAKKK